MEQQQEGMIQTFTFIQELQDDIKRCKNEEILITNLRERQEVVKMNSYNLTFSVNEFETLQYGFDVQLYQAEAIKIWTLMQDLTAQFQLILTASQQLVSTLQNYFTCYKRVQQLHAIGIDADPSLVHIQDVRMLTDRILALFSEIHSMFQYAIASFDIERICRCSNAHQYFNIQGARDACKSLEIYKIELEKLVTFIYKKFSLVVTQQPLQIIQLNSVSGVSLSVTLFNFNNILTAPVPIEVFLINEPVSETIVVAEALPDKLEICGTISPSKSSTTEEKLDVKERRRKRKGVRLNTQNLNHVSINPYGTGPAAKSANTGMRVESMVPSPDGTEFTIQLGIAVTNVKRLKTNVKGSNETVKEEKYCLLFVVDLPIHNQVLRVWTTSLPVIVVPHSYYNEGAWATIAWDNVFPVHGRTGFQVQPTANVPKVYEMLKTLFKKFVGNELKPMHEKCIVDKLKSYMVEGNNSTASCSEISWRAIVGDGKTSFWSYFYRAMMIVTGHLQNAWLSGHIEGFISWEDAHQLLIQQNKPGTFLVRFSDSAPGCVSLVLHTNNGKVCRITPLEFYKHKEFANCVGPFLHQLNIIYRNSGEDAFLWVYPETCKKLAFETFYKESVKLKLKLNPHYWPLLTVLKGDMRDQANNNASTNERRQSEDHQSLNLTAAGGERNQLSNANTIQMEESIDFELLTAIITDEENPI